jgi:hypothetical protein
MERSPKNRNIKEYSIDWILRRLRMTTPVYWKNWNLSLSLGRG